VQGSVGGGSYEQLNAIIWASYGRPGETLEDFNSMMRGEALAWNAKMGGQRPWAAPGFGEITNIYHAYNDADPWTGPGAVQAGMPEGRGVSYELGGGGLSHCVDNPLGAQEWVRRWATPIMANATQ
jgi:hypothetical protein